MSISRFLHVSRPTVDLWIARFEEEHMAGLVDHKDGVHRSGIRQRRPTLQGASRQRPAEGQWIAIDITGAAAIELHGLPHHDCLIEASIGYW